MKLQLARALLGLTFAALANHACTPRSAVVTGTSPNQQTSRTANEFALRTKTHEYSVAFLHDQATQSYSVAATAWSGSEQEREPHWLEFSIRGERTRLTRWSKLAQKRKLVTQPFSCTGVLARRCGRAQLVKPHYTWLYPLPQELAVRLATAQQVQATLAVGEIAIVRDLHEELDWIHEFFKATTSGTAYR